MNKIIEEGKFKDIESLKKEVSQIMLDSNYSTYSFNTYKFPGFYRARKHTHLEGSLKQGILKKFVNEKEFWNVPKEFAKIGRCNLENESIFYCANDIITAILEVKPDVGEFVTISRFKNSFPDKIYKVQPLAKRFLLQIPVLKEKLFKKYTFDIKHTECEDFFKKLFFQNIDKEEDNYKYKYSIALAHLFFTDTINEKEVFQTHALLYPSIARNNKSFCFAIKPWIVNSFFEIDTIQTVQVLDKTNEYIKIKLLRNGFKNGLKIYPADKFNITWYICPKSEKNIELLNLSDEFRF